MAVFFRERLGAAEAVTDDVKSFSAGDEFVIGIAVNFVGEANGAALKFGDVGADAKSVVEFGGAAITALGFGDDNEAVVVLFHFAVAEAEGATEFDAAYFEPGVIVTVVDHAHLVGFGVTDPDVGVVLGGLERLGVVSFVHGFLSFR